MDQACQIWNASEFERSKYYGQWMGKATASYRWSGWVWEIIGWNSRLQENCQSFQRNLKNISQNNQKNRKMSICNQLEFETLGSRLDYDQNSPKGSIVSYQQKSQKAWYAIWLSMIHLDEGMTMTCVAWCDVHQWQCWHHCATLHKVDMFKINIFLLAPTSCRIWNTQSMQGDKQIQLVFIIVCLITCGSRMNILFIIKVKILVSIKWSYMSPNHVDY